MAVAGRGGQVRYKKMASLTLMLMVAISVSGQESHLNATPTERPRNNPQRASFTRKLDPLKDMSAEKALLNILLNNYGRVGRSGRPVLNVTTSMKVFFTLGLIQMDLDEKYKILTMSMWTRYQWRDEYMVWDPKDFDNVDSIRVEPNMIWIPDITLYNTASAEADTRDALAVVSSDGVVTWYPHSIFQSSCSVDVTNFPFDDQQCHMWFGSWTHTSRQIDLRMGVQGGIDLSTFQADYKESCAWDIVNITTQRKIMPSEKDSPNFVVLTFDLSIRRKLVFSSYILTLPCVFLAFLTLVVFWLPPGRPDRICLAMSTFNSFMLLLLILVEAAPPTASSVPTLGVYYCFNLVIIMLSIILSSLVINISQGSDRRVPRWLYHLTIGWVAKVKSLRLFVHASSHSPRPGIDNESVLLRQSSAADDGGAAHSLGNGDAFTPLVGLNFPENGRVVFPKGCEERLRDIKCVLLKIESGLDLVNNKLGGVHKARAEWKLVATFLDRFFFVVYITLIVVSLTTWFPRPT